MAIGSDLQQLVLTTEQAEFLSLYVLFNVQILLVGEAVSILLFENNTRSQIPCTVLPYSSALMFLLEGF